MRGAAPTTGREWEVTTRQENIDSALEGRYAEHEAAAAASEAWASQRKRTWSHLIAELPSEPGAEAMPSWPKRLPSYIKRHLGCAIRTERS